MKTLGVPYPGAEVAQANDLLTQQAQVIAEDLQKQGIDNVNRDSELIALIAYLQKLGKTTRLPGQEEGAKW